MNIRTLIAIIFSMLIFFSWNHVEKFFFPKIYRYKKFQYKKKQNQKKSLLKTSKNFLIEDNDQDSLVKNKKTSGFSFNDESLQKDQHIDNGERLTIQSKEMSLSISTVGGLLKDVSINDNVLIHNENFFAFLEENQKWNRVVYSVVKKNDQSLLLEYKTPDLLIIQKSYKIIKPYLCEVKINFINKNIGTYRCLDGFCFSSIRSLGNIKHWKKEKRYFKISTLGDTERKIHTYRKIKTRKIVYDSPFWISWHNKYYAVIVRPFQKMLRLYLDKGTPFPLLAFRGSNFSIPSQKAYSEKFLMYCGPKDRNLLKKQGSQFEKVVSFGFFNKISLVLLFILNFFYSIFGNYGVSIILLTILVKLLLFPLSQKSFHSMKKMQKIQPHIEGLRKKYSDDPRQLQMEMTKMYRTQKINPVGGCLPVLAQMPFFLALFWLLQSAFELKGAPFLWIKDLSSKDTTFILPILMGCSMFLQQATSPSIVEKKQKKIMMIIPLMMTFLFLGFPAGLVLYWLFSNLISIFYQQFNK